MALIDLFEPVIGSTGWGEAVNKNFSDIEKALTGENKSGDPGDQFEIGPILVGFGSTSVSPVSLLELFDWGSQVVLTMTGGGGSSDPQIQFAEYDGGHDVKFSLGYDAGDDTFKICSQAGLSSAYDLVMNGDGKVGIGTSSPYEELHVEGDVYVSGGVGIGTNDTTNKLNVNGRAAIGNGFYTSTAPDDGLIVQGNVGIGITDPTEKVHIDGNTQVTSGGWIGLGSGSGRMRLQDDVTDSIEFLDCNVGIGTSPFEKLSVQGNIGMMQDYWIGIGSGSARMEFRYTDKYLANLLDCNVGIGTSDPGSYRLRVEGDAYFSGHVGLGSSVDVSGYLQVTDDGWVGLGSSSGRIEFHDEATDRLCFMDCWVGIGGCPPAHELDVFGDAAVREELFVDVIKEFTEDAGVRVEDVLLRDGSVGIGTTPDSYRLRVSGPVNVIGATYFEGNVGIKTSSGTYKLVVEGEAGISSELDVDTIKEYTGDAGVTVEDVLLKGGNVGIGTTEFGGFRLRVGGDVDVVGSAYFKDKVGIGVTYTDHELHVEGDQYVSGWVGIGTYPVSNKLGVYGNASVGSGYAGTTAPQDGLIVEGNVGIGFTSPQEKLDVNGKVRADEFIEYSPFFVGDALSAIKEIKPKEGGEGDWQEVDHNTLPPGVRVKMGRSLGRSLNGSVQLNTRALQQLSESVDGFEKRLAKVEKKA